MIEHIKGDLLDIYDKGSLDVIAHCCNNQGVMGSGIALQVKQRFPYAYDAYIDHHDAIGLELGTISTGWEESGSKLIINLHAQAGYGSGIRFVNYEAFYISLEKTKSLMKKYDMKTIGFPKLIACDRAGGDWRIVQAMIEVVFEDFDVLIVEYNKN